MDANEEKKTDEKREQKPHSAFGWRQNVHWIERLQCRTVMMSVRFSKLENHENFLGTISIYFSKFLLLRHVCVCVCICVWKLSAGISSVFFFPNRTIVVLCFLSMDQIPASVSKHYVHLYRNIPVGRIRWKHMRNEQH